MEKSAISNDSTNREHTKTNRYSRNERYPAKILNRQALELTLTRIVNKARADEKNVLQEQDTMTVH
jgi:hypothetical protein